MDIEFHYYMTHLIALRAGFNKADALKIAYASQLTDDNVDSYRIDGGNTPYYNRMSQTMNILKPQEERLSIYPVFHFCPGTKEELIQKSPMRTDGKFYLLTTIPDNKNAVQIFNEALKTGEPYRIGIATHMYADTFCHRDFAGLKDDFNFIKLDGFVGGVVSPLVPAIGHALAMHYPDIPPIVWEDTRLTSKYCRKSNREQILLAAGKVFDFYCNLTKPGKSQSSNKDKLLDDLKGAIGNESEEDSTKATRDQNYKTLLGADYVEYDEDQWFNKAVDKKFDSQTVGTSESKNIYVWKKDYLESDWYKFQEAVKQHHQVAMDVLKSTFDLMGIDEKTLVGKPYDDAV